MTFGGVVGASSLAYDGRFLITARAMSTHQRPTWRKHRRHTLKRESYRAAAAARWPWANNSTGAFDFGVNANNPLIRPAYANAAFRVFTVTRRPQAHPVSRIYSRGVDFFGAGHLEDLAASDARLRRFALTGSSPSGTTTTNWRGFAPDVTT